MKSNKNNSNKNQRIRTKTWIAIFGIWCITGIIAYYILSSILIQPPFKPAKIKGDIIAQVGDIKIGKDELIEKTQELLKHIPDWDEKENGATPPQFVLTQMTNDALFDNFINELKIYTSEKEIETAILGNPTKGIKPIQMVEDFKTFYNITSMETFIDMVENPSKYNVPLDLIAENSNLLKDLQSIILNHIKTQKVANIFARALQANKIDTKMLYDDATEINHISFVKKECANIADAEIIVTEDEINNYWQKEKKSFSLANENRKISYINVIISPSKEDLAQADIIIQNIKEYLSNGKNTDILTLPGISIDTLSITANETDNYQLINFQAIAQPGDIKLLSIMDNEYTIAKYVGKSDKGLTFVEAKYRLTPSEKTITDLKKNLSDYATKFNSASVFSDSANTYGYIVHSYYATNVSSRIAFLYESREALQWAMTANKGAVSDVFEIGKDGYLIVAIDDIYKSYIPATDPAIRNNITTHIKNKKKTEILATQYTNKANDIQGYSELLNTPIEYAKVAFDKATIQGFGTREPNLLGIIPVEEPNKLIGPITCKNSIVFAVIDSVESKRNEFTYDFNELSLVYFSKIGGATIFSKIPDILIGNNEYIIKELLPTCTD